MAFALKEKHLSPTADWEHIRALSEQVDEKYPPSSWVIDREHDLILLCFSVGRQSIHSDEETTGRYVFFIKGRPLRLEAYLRGWMEERHYQILPFQLPSDLDMEPEQLLYRIRDAFVIEGTRYSNEYKAIKRVDVEFDGLLP
ncbi:hypothetical protein SAMN05660284_00329 [Formivibrio citricus]|uniref:Uncharacterized protein n=1 Tax=Formivibrio citricus TaxID=83765 RepID=A0A1I4VR75_9NEIS|nr:hypothetical protein [Formivibrio citricus]SFN03519.1 hypothetical protein SAMN05660284_00329 [Formivibrio citricus]